MVEGYRKDVSGEYTGEKISVTAPQDMGDSPRTGAELMQEGKEPQSPTPSAGKMDGGKYGDPQAPAIQAGMQAIQHLAAGKLDRRFYGHILPEQFKKTSIISTTGRVR